MTITITGALLLAAMLVTAWLLYRFVDWAYRIGLGEPADEPPVPATPQVDPVDDAAARAPVLTGR